MSPTRRSALAVAVALGLLSSSTLADVAGAQDAPAAPSSTAGPSTSVAASTPSTSVAGDQPTTTLAGPDTTVGVTTTTGVQRAQPEEVSTSTTTSVPDTTVIAPPPSDGVIESATESVPIVPAALVELPTSKGGRPARVVAGVPARVSAMLRAAKDANDETLANLAEAESANAITSRQVAAAQARVDRLSEKERATLDALAAARSVFEERVRWAYTRGGTATLEGFLQSRDAAQLTDRRAMVQFVLEEDADAMNSYIALKDSVTASVATADDMLNRALHSHASTQMAVDGAHADVALTTLSMAVWDRASRGLRDLVFPVVGPHAFGGDFGAPRMVGSADEHTHQGNDIAAPLGAQLVAVEPGMVVAVGTDRLGGNKLWLAGKSGTYYYYAHLSRFADDVKEGDIVPAGTVVGYVGNTGNARGGIPHLHFEIHPNGGVAVDPAAYLAAADRRQRQEKWAL